MLDRRLNLLKEAWNQLDEMPDWNDGNKDISRYIKGEVDEIVKDKLERGYTIVEENVSIRNSFAATILSRYNGRTLCVLVYFDKKDAINNREFVGEFYWHHDAGMWKTESVAVKEKYQGIGIAFNVYVYMIENYMQTLYSDTSLTGEVGKGSFDIWVKLGKYFPFKYVYDEEGNMLEAVDGFTREMMGDENIRFVVSTKEAIEDEDAVTESLVKLPTEDIRQWVDVHYDEFIAKLTETLKKGYDTTIDDYIVFTNPYTKEKFEVFVEIRKNVMNMNKHRLELYFDHKHRQIVINASVFYANYKKNLREALISGLLHELTHAVDPGSDFRSTSIKDYGDYANSEGEFVAHSQEYADMVKHLPDAKKEAVLNRIRAGKKTGIKDMDIFISYLHADNRKRFIKNLYKAISSPQSAAPNA
jgi:uncharacterized protein YeeX (DUF496 family)